MTDPVVIVGGGQAAVQLCLALRKEKYDGDIIVCSDEAELPYHRPPLSKAYIVGKTDDEKLLMRPESFYQSRNIDLRLNSRATEIDAAAKTLTIDAQGKRHQLTYRFLVLTMGAKARHLPIAGRESTGVEELRDINDARSIKTQLPDCKNVVIIGAGFIGLEAAAVLNQSDIKVTVFDTADRVMGRAVAPQISHWFESAHRQAGIDIHLSEGVSEIVAGSSGAVSGVIRNNGETVAADMVLIGIGVEPHTGLAASAGLDCDNGIAVDEFCRTSDSSIFAAGDCANHPNTFAGGRRVRLESVQNATDQARTIAGAIAAAVNNVEPSRPYRAVPWFWSDQADNSLQMAGLSFDADNYVTRGDPSAGSFSVFHFNGESLMAVDSVNASRDHMLARKLLGAGTSPTPAEAQHPEFDLKSLI